MTLLATLDFDDQTPGQPVSVSLPWNLSTAGTAPVIALAESAIHGALGARVSSTDSYRGIYYKEAQTSDTRVIDFYMRPMFVLSNTFVAKVIDGSTSRAEIRLNSNGTVSIRDGWTSVDTSTETLALNGSAVYRFAWMISTSGQELRVYAGESTTPLFTLAGSLADASHTDIGAGLTSTPEGFTADYDTIRVADDWLPPFGAAEEPLATPANFTFAASSTPGVAEITADADPVNGAASYELEVEQRIEGLWQPLDTFTTSTLPLVLDGDDGIVVSRTYRGRIRALPGA